MGTLLNECMWPVDADCLPEATEENREQLRDAIDTATTVLWGLTGRRFGICPYEVTVDALPDNHCGPWGKATVRAHKLPGTVQAVTEVLDAQGNPVDGVKVSGQWVRDLPPSEVTIRYLAGEPIPEGAALAVGRLAKERYLQCIGDKRCRLPSGATQVTRQGVSVQMMNPSDFLDQGRTGLPEVDMWVSSVNPYGMAEPSEVL